MINFLRKESARPRENPGYAHVAVLCDLNLHGRWVLPIHRIAANSTTVTIGERGVFLLLQRVHRIGYKLSWKCRYQPLLSKDIWRCFYFMLPVTWSI